MRAAPLLAVLVLSLLSTSQSRASDAAGGLELIIAEFADQIKVWTKEAGANELSFGGIQDPADANAGPHLTELLVRQLKGTGIAIKLKARYALFGEYYAASNREQVSIEFFVRDTERDNQKVKLFDKLFVTDPDVVALLIAPTGSRPETEPTEEESDGASTEQSSNKTEFVTAKFAGNVIYPEGNEAFGLELLIKDGNQYQPISPVDEEGYAFVDLPLGAIYAIRVHNNTEDAVAVQLLIDGTSSFEYCQKRKQGPNGVDQPGYTHFIVKPNSQGFIKGWYVTESRAYEFLVGEHGGLENTDVSHEVRKQAASSRIGTITAMFYNARPVQSDDQGRSRSFIPKKTMVGEEIETNYSLVRYTWDDTYRSVVSVRYSK